jgi:amidophosphoribosyltransferase
MTRKLKEHCGVVGIMHHPKSLQLTYFGIYALQHRGQEGAGILGFPKPLVVPPYCRIRDGLVGDAFKRKHIASHNLHYAMGHVRYSTSGSKDKGSHQPIVHELPGGKYFALAHNGTIPAYQAKASSKKGVCENDSYQLLQRIVAHYKPSDPLAGFKRALEGIEGAYCLVVFCPEGMLFARDPWGFRPLALGRLDKAPIVCSETCALDLMGATFEKEIEPGEIGFIPFEENTIQWGRVETPQNFTNQHQCIFELIYFARPDSQVFSHGVYEARKTLGRLLAEDYKVKADLVISVPDSGVPASRGFAEATGIPWDLGIIRNHYIHRTFIEPPEGFRDFGVKIKHNPIREVLEGKDIVVVDDSLVRSTTSRKIISLLRNAGAKKVHFAISSPPMAWPCFYGIDTPNRNELIAASHTIPEIQKSIGADSLGYLSLERLQKHFGDKFCYTCFNGKYDPAKEVIQKLL